MRGARSCKLWLVSALQLALALASASSATLPLEWVDQQAYVATAAIDGISRQLQVGTVDGTIWLSCAYTSGGCDPSQCDWRVDTERSQRCATVANASLSLGGEYTSDVPLQVVQSDSILAGSSSSSMPIALVTGAQGSLGLGRGAGSGGNGASIRQPLVAAFQNFSIYLSTDRDGAGSFVRLGSDQASDTSLHLASGWMAQYSVPVRETHANANTKDEPKRWDVSLNGVRFGDSKLLYPRVYEQGLVPGGGVAATISLNHAALEMPIEILQLFQAAFLAFCSQATISKTGNGFFNCPASVMDTLPRIGLYIDTKIFYLDPSDYTHVSSANASDVVVDVAVSEVPSQWVLGAPFLRKFPSHFSTMPLTVELFCTVGLSCRPQPPGPLEQSPVDSAESALAPVPDYISQGTPSPTPRMATRQVTAVVIMLWMGLLFVALGSVATVVNLVESWRARRRGYRRDEFLAGTDDVKTVASEHDLEESTEALRGMNSFAGDYTPVRSPRS